MINTESNQENEFTLEFEKSVVIPEPLNVPDKTNLTFNEKNTTNKKKISKIFIIFLIIIVFLIIMAGISAIIIAATIPCSFTKCHANAKCINRPFYADCECNNGYNGNGRDFCDECGVTYFANNANDYGQKVNPYSWPATGILEYVYSSLEKLDSERILISSYGYCGVVLISRNTALTSADCIKKKFIYHDWYNDKYYEIKIEPNNFHPTMESIYSFYFGVENFVYYGVDLPRVTLADFSDIIYHEDYNPQTLENNIAIIKFTKPLELNRYIQIACLPNQTSYTMPEGHHQHAFIAGFGSSGSGYSEWSMQNIRINLYNTSMCDNVKVNNTKNWNLQFCAGEYNEYSNETGNCHGDYGSAVYIHDHVNNKQKYIATGLLSYDESCDTIHTPGVYTRLSAYIDWIKKNLKL